MLKNSHPYYLHTVVKSVKSPTEGTTFTIEPSSVLEKNCFLDSYAANGEPENKSCKFNKTKYLCNIFIPQIKGSVYATYLM